MSLKVDEYGIPLQLVYHILVRNSELADADMRYYLLDSVHVLAIQCDVLSSVAKSHKKFLQWCQEPLLTGILWHLLESSHSQVKMGPRPFSSRICYFHVQLKLFPRKQEAQCKILGKRFPCPNLLSKLTKPCTFWYTFLG